MNKMIKIYFLLVCFWLSLSVQAQTVPHVNIWKKISLTQPIAPKFKTELDVQHRSQNNFFGNNSPFEENLLSSLRLTLMYQLNNRIAIHFSPFSYFNHHAIIQHENDLSRPSNHEIRFLAGLEVQGKLANRLKIFNKTGVEYRDFDTNGNTVRLRHKISLRYEINDEISLQLYEEPLVNIVGVPIHHFFDHNRLALLGSYQPTKHWRVETGYIHINRLSRNSAVTLEEENIVLNLYYTFNSFTKHKS
jgi:hypothetical protein